MRKYFLIVFCLIINCVSNKPITNEQVQWCSSQYIYLLDKGIEDNSFILKNKAYKTAVLESFESKGLPVEEIYKISKNKYWQTIENIENTYPEFNNIKGEYRKIYENTLSNNNSGDNLLRDYPLLYELNIYFEIEMLNEENTFSELHCMIWEKISN